MAIDNPYYILRNADCLVPIVCSFLYRSYSENGDEKAGVAGIAALLSVLFWILRGVQCSQ